MNLVGHVAVALTPDRADPPPEFLVGCMLPDLAAIARVRMTRPDGDLGRGVEFHHACDSVFHESAWFRETNRDVRDALLAAGVTTGAARACSHAGTEMLLDGALVAEPRVGACTQRTLDAVDADAESLASLAPADTRAVVARRLHLVGSSLDPRRYRDPGFVADRLHRMTAGRRRIEVHAYEVGAVATTLAEFAPAIRAAAPEIVAAVRQAVPSHRHPV
jgi:hypothetical protein